MFDGYLTFAGNEVVNVARTYAYIDAGYAPPGVTVNRCIECDTLPEAINDGKPYVSPIIDEAPWFDENNPDTWDFAGLIPLEITGLSGSTRTAEVTENARDGGAASLVRYASRTVAVTALLVGRTGASVEEGLVWLTQILQGTTCTVGTSTTPCAGDTLCAFASCPDSLDEVEDPSRGLVTEHLDPAQTGWRVTGGVFDQTTGLVAPAPGQVLRLTGPTLPCFSTASFSWNLRTTSGAVQAAAGAMNPTTGAIILPADGSVPPLTPITGGANGTIVPQKDWGDWVPVLWLSGRDAVIDPTWIHPAVMTVEDCVEKITRSYLDVTTIAGPTVTERIDFDCGYALKVEWTWHVGNPAIVAGSRTLVGNWSSAHNTADALGNGVVINDQGTMPGDKAACVFTVSAWWGDDPDTKCLTDPCCPGWVAPPQPPVLIDPCISVDGQVRRWSVTIPEIYSSNNMAVSAVTTIRNDNKPKRGLRIRLLQDPLAQGYNPANACNVCGEFNITYLPPKATMVIDGVRGTITTACENGVPVSTSASVRGSFVSDSSGHLAALPFEFPMLECSTSYVALVDIPVAYTKACGGHAVGESQGYLSLDVATYEVTL